MTDNVIPLLHWPSLEEEEEAEAERARLRQLEADLSAPIVALARELGHLRRVRDEAEKAMNKVAEHQRRGYERIAVGAFAELGAVLDGRRR